MLLWPELYGVMCCAETSAAGKAGAVVQQAVCAGDPQASERAPQDGPPTPMPRPPWLPCGKKGQEEVCCQPSGTGLGVPGASSCFHQLQSITG